VVEADVLPFGKDTVEIAMVEIKDWICLLARNNFQGEKLRLGRPSRAVISITHCAKNNIDAKMPASVKVGKV